MSNEPTIRVYDFDKIGLDEVLQEPRGQNWPVVYLIHDNENLYIGETTSVHMRMKQHLDNEAKKNLKTIAIVFDDWYNKSVILDYEQRLIKYCSVDKKFKNILNRNKGQQADHDYYDRDHYRKQFGVLWKELRKHHLAEHSLEIIENDNIFKFSPYNALTGEQNEVGIAVMNEILDSFSKNQNGVSLVNGCAGTGKTVLAISIINSLVNAKNIDDELLKNPSEFEENDIEESKRGVLLRIKEYIKKERNGKPFKIGFVFPMEGIRTTVQNVFKECGNGLTAKMVIAPSNVDKEKYDILFVDESHRLSKRKNITNYKSFDDTSNNLGLNPEETNQLEWILKSAKHVVLFYDEYQSVKSSDITYSEYQNSLRKFGTNIYEPHELQTQMRCEGGGTYIQYVKDLMNCSLKDDEFKNMENDYKFLIFDNVNNMIEKVREKDDLYGLSKTVAGFSWEWKTKKQGVKDNMDYYNDLEKNHIYDISIGDYKYIWNTNGENWINRKDSHCTIGCIHTTQGYDMNYVGVIFGEEINYDPESNSMVIDLNKYMDTKVKQKTDADVLKRLILNTYTTIMARGIKGCYVYACNENLRNYLKKHIAHANNETSESKA